VSSEKYICFVRARDDYSLTPHYFTPVVLEETPGMSMVDVAKELGSRWKALSDDDRLVYANKSAADKERYESEVKQYSVSPANSSIFHQNF